MANEGQELEPLQVLAIWKLLFTGEEPKISDMKPSLTPAKRNRLRDLGLIELEKREGISKTGRKSHATHVVLTDEAWRWAAEHLDAAFSTNSPNGAKALAGLLPRLKAYMERNGVTLAELLAPAEEEEPAETRDREEQIREAYRALANGAWNVPVRIAQLRSWLTGIPRHELDEALLRMQREDKLVLYPNNDPQDLRPEDHDGAIDVAGSKRHLVYMGSA